MNLHLTNRTSSNMPAHVSAIFHDTSLSNWVYLSMDNIRRDVVDRSLTRFVAKSSCPPSHSMAASRDKLHLTRHHPIHAQHFTSRSGHSRAQVVTQQPDIRLFFVFRHGRPHCHNFQLLIAIWVPTNFWRQPGPSTAVFFDSSCGDCW